MPVPQEAPMLLDSLLIAFNRAGEDTSLAFKQRHLATSYRESSEVEDDITFEEEIIFERIDSNILYALQSYLSKSPDNVITFIKVLEGKMMEFMRKCARLLQIYITPYVDPTITKGILLRKKTPEEEMEEMRFNEHKGQLMPMHV